MSIFTLEMSCGKIRMLDLNLYIYGGRCTKCGLPYYIPRFWPQGDPNPIVLYQCLCNGNIVKSISEITDWKVTDERKESKEDSKTKITTYN